MWQALATEGEINAVLGEKTTRGDVVPLAAPPRATADVEAAALSAAEELQVCYLLVSTCGLVRTSHYLLLTAFQMVYCRALDAELRVLQGMPEREDGADLGFDDLEVGVSEYVSSKSWQWRQIPGNS